jgi:OOP family OmpA-OmpF porin
VDVLVEGHTDNVGKPKYNKKLSDKRAASVVKWLVDHGIETTRLRSAGIGMDRPLASNDDEVGRQTNRRVEFHIKQDESKKKDDDESSDGAGESSDSGSEESSDTSESSDAEASSDEEAPPKKKAPAKKPVVDDDDDPLRGL